MPAPPPFSSPHNQPQFPALYLYPLNDSFVPKHITLLHNQHVKIGRQTNVKTVPASRNGYFDSKVLSRQHAEVWEDGGKIFIKDVKSSNGTFINGERLSPEGLESEPYELKSDDIVEFGIDIVGEDNKTVIHHKVAARVVCVFSEQDAQIAARAEQHQSSATLAMSSHAGPSSSPSASTSAPSSFNFSNGAQNGGPSTAQRRLPMQQGLTAMGELNRNIRPPGKSGLTFDHIVNRLQGELQKSRETGAELHSLTGAMGDIHDTLAGSLPANLPSYPQSLPSVRPPQHSSEHASLPDQPPQPVSAAAPASALADLQAQLHETQVSLANHVEKIRALDSMLAEHEAIKREVGELRDMMEERRREVGIGLPRRPEHDDRIHHDIESEREIDSDDDDARSIRTIIPHELERVDEEDEDQLTVDEEEEEEDRRRRREELARPRTPEPTGMGMVIAMTDDDYVSQRSHRSPSPPTLRSSVVDELTSRLATLSDQLESALEMSSTLQAQHVAAQGTISTLETKVSALESLLQITQSQIQSQAQERQKEKEQPKEREESLTAILNEWKKTVEGQWSSVKEEWSQERERLSRAREEWEGRVKSVETGLGSAMGKIDILSFQQRPLVNGDVKHIHGGGLVTPPSPRSLSADSNRPRQRKKRSGSSRGRSRSRSGSIPRRDTVDSEGSCETTDSSGGGSVPSVVNGCRPSSMLFASGGEGVKHSYPPEVPDPSYLEMLEEKMKTMKAAARSLVTPDPSVQMSSSTVTMDSTKSDGNLGDVGLTEDGNSIKITTAVGIVVLSVVTAAVLWRVKPE